MAKESNSGLKVSEAARLLGLADGTVRNYAHAEIIPSYRTERGHRRFHKLDVLAFAARRQQAREADDET
jgi:excisionase family DNA binding protein